MAPAAGQPRGIARGRVLRIAVVLVAAAVAAVILWPDPEEEQETISDPVAAGAELVRLLRATLPLPSFSSAPPEPVPGPRFAIARVREGRSVALRTRPGGTVVAKLGDVTEFGSRRTFWIAKIRGDWFGVATEELPNGRRGWIRDDRLDLEISVTHYWLLADRSERLLELYYGEQLLDRYPITVGAAATPTPLGSFGITDALAGPSLGPYYGCCVLALSGRQPNLPPAWFGGDRMAIHGTPGEVGVAASAGCLRTTDETMIALFARVPLGAPVYVRE